MKLVGMVFLVNCVYAIAETCTDSNRGPYHVILRLAAIKVRSERTTISDVWHCPSMCARIGGKKVGFNATHNMFSACGHH